MEVASVGAARLNVRERVSAYVALTKPRIIELLLITTVPSMVLAAQQWPGTWLVLATLMGGTLSAAGANALNCYFDRDIDSSMRRTSRRPLPQQRVEPERAAIFGGSLALAGLLWLGLTVNWTAALISTGAVLFYVLVYTIALKRSTVQNIVIGGAAGAAPVLVGWAAVQGALALPAWVLAAIVFYWTPPHFWALALPFRDDYEAAGVPMLPVVKGVEATTRQILVYSGVMVLVSLLLVPAAGMEWIYLGSAIALGAWFVFEAWMVRRHPERAMKLFTASTFYLTALFAAVMVDVLV